MQLITKAQCVHLIDTGKPYCSVSIIDDYDKEERNISCISKILDSAHEIYTDAFIADTYITIDIHFYEKGRYKIARLLVL